MNRIGEILHQLHDNFMEDKGGGYSFLYMCQDKNGELCMEQLTAQELLLLGLASGWCNIPLPRSFWNILPGGVPYVTILNNKKNVLPISKEDLDKE